MANDTNNTHDTFAQQLRDATALSHGRALTGVSIAARATLSAHALNNEGTVNNAQMERQVNVVHDGEVVTVNAVSGDVLKHGFIDHLRALAMGAMSAFWPASSMPLSIG